MYSLKEHFLLLHSTLMFFYAQTKRHQVKKRKKFFNFPNAYRSVLRILFLQCVCKSVVTVF